MPIFLRNLGFHLTYRFQSTPGVDFLANHTERVNMGGGHPTYILSYCTGSTWSMSIAFRNHIFLLPRLTGINWQQRPFLSSANFDISVVRSSRPPPVLPIEGERGRGALLYRPPPGWYGRGGAEDMIRLYSASLGPSLPLLSFCGRHDFFNMANPLKKRTIVFQEPQKVEQTHSIFFPRFSPKFPPPPNL